MANTDYVKVRKKKQICGGSLYMDVGYKNEEGNFSLRAAALIINDNCLMKEKTWGAGL